MNSSIIAKAKQIQALFLDVDGVLTDGSFYLTPHGEEIKRFHTQDGQGLKNLQEQGIIIAIISGRKSKTVIHRMQELKIKYVYQGVASKLTTYQELKQKFNLDDEAIAYMGDDLIDLPVLEQVGLSIAPANAVLAVKQKVHWVTERDGGSAAVREVCDLFLLAKTYAS